MDGKSDQYPGGYKTNTLQIALFTVFLYPFPDRKNRVFWDEKEFFPDAFRSFLG